MTIPIYIKIYFNKNNINLFEKINFFFINNLSQIAFKNKVLTKRD